MSQELILTQGFPGSGKSTWALEQVKNNKNVSRVNRDSVRAMFGTGWGQKFRDEAIVTSVCHDTINTLLSMGKSVICDDTNINPKTVDSLRHLADGHNVPVVINDSFLSVPLEECIKRDAARANGVGKDVILEFYYRYWATQPKPENTGLKTAVICDLDGTLCLLPVGMKYPAAYNRDYRGDRLNPAVASLLTSVTGGKVHSDPVLLLVSGRFSEKRDQTEEWLSSHNISYKTLHCRSIGDRRPDTIIKKEIYMNHIQGTYKVEYVIDDRPSVVRMWRAELGLPVFQVAPDIEF